MERFLEIVTQELRCSPAVYNTLLELHLKQVAAVQSKAEPSSGEEEALLERQAKIMHLLKTQPVDTEQALLLTKLYRNERAMLFLLDKLQLAQETLQYHMAQGNYPKVLQTCRRYEIGSGRGQECNLWVQALSYFAAKDQPCLEEIQEVLENIDRLKLLPPLRVVQILGSNPNKPLAVVKDYLVRNLQHEMKLIQKDQAEIARLRGDSEKKREDIRKLQLEPIVFNGFKCMTCKDAPSFPAVHFLCEHSFHQRCVESSDRECPICGPEYSKVREKRDSFRESAVQHDRFLKMLEDARDDGFSTVAEFFRRGLFDVDRERESIGVHRSGSHAPRGPSGGRSPSMDED